MHERPRAVTIELKSPSTHLESVAALPCEVFTIAKLIQMKVTQRRLIAVNPLSIYADNMFNVSAFGTFRVLHANGQWMRRRRLCVHCGSKRLADAVAVRPCRGLVYMLLMFNLPINWQGHR